jgi:hypothetical protein
MHIARGPVLLSVACRFGVGLGLSHSVQCVMYISLNCAKNRVFVCVRA